MRRCGNSRGAGCFQKHHQVESKETLLLIFFAYDFNISQTVLSISIIIITKLNLKIKVEICRTPSRYQITIYNHWHMNSRYSPTDNCTLLTIKYIINWYRGAQLCLIIALCQLLDIQMSKTKPKKIRDKFKS